MPIIPASELDITSYHSAQYLSTHKLKDFASKGPRYYAARHVTNKYPKAPDTEALVFGRCFEDLVYGLPITDSFIMKPEGMSFATKEGKAWRAEAEATGKAIVAADDFEAMQMMRESLLENETAMAMIRACEKQTTFRCEYEGTPGLQSRPDWDSASGCLESGYAPFTLDLKSTQTLQKITSGRGIVEYLYHAQAAICQYTARKNQRDVRCYLLAVEKVMPYRAQVVEVTPDWLAVGWQWCERQLEKLAKHYATNEWPRVTQEMVELPPVPEWATRVDSANDDEEGAAA